MGTDAKELAEPAEPDIMDPGRPHTMRKKLTHQDSVRSNADEQQEGKHSRTFSKQRSLFTDKKKLGSAHRKY